MMRSFLFCAAFALVCSGAAHAQNPLEERSQAPSEEALVIAREVVLLTGGESAMQDMVESVRPMMLADLTGRGMSPERAERYLTIFIQEFQSEFPRIIELAAIAYAGAFSIQQLEEIRAFYQTETGQAVVERTPELTMAMMRAGMLIAEEITPRVIERFTDEPPASPS